MMDSAQILKNHGTIANIYRMLIFMSITAAQIPPILSTIQHQALLPALRGIRLRLVLHLTQWMTVPAL